MEGKQHTLVQDIAQVRNILQFGLGNFRLGLSAVSEFLDDFTTESVPNMRMASQVEESRTEQTSSSVTSSKEDVKHVISEDLGVRGFCCQCFGKNVSASRFLLLGVSLGFECKIHIVIDNFVHASAGVLELLRIHHPVEVLCSGSGSEVILGQAKRFSETLCISNRRLFQQTRVRRGGTH